MEKDTARVFYVELPIGRLKIWAKADWGDIANDDNPEDFPGVFIDLELPNKDTIMLACIEWESCSKEIQACIYSNCMNEDPTYIITYEDIQEAINYSNSFEEEKNE
jgi:hypothetical protein